MMSLRLARVAVLALGLALSASPGSGATIQIINKDSAGEGLNDATLVAPVGGNSGTTRGAQRLNVFTQAAAIWGAILPSTVTIKCDCNFNPLLCDANGAVLGSTAPKTALRDFTGAQWASTWYVVALANKLHGSDLDVANDDMTAQFNSQLDTGCLPGTKWYYGFDHNHGNDIDLLAVVLHEMGHGLGFTSLVDPTDGQYAGYPGDPHTDAFTRFLFDDTQNKYWDQLTAAQRVTSAVNTGGLVWRGDLTKRYTPSFLGTRLSVSFSGTGGFTGDKEFSTADFGPPLGSPPVTGPVVLVNDGAAPTSDGCSAIINGALLSGKIAAIDRGTCNFDVKTKNAQLAGAIGVVLLNNQGTLPLMSGTDATITIPTVCITQTDGAALKAALGSGTVIVSMGTKPPPALQGSDDNGWVRMYAPNPVESGSSVSHFDTEASPDLLMEPIITPNLTSSVDLTRFVFGDMGWIDATTATIITELAAEPTEDGFRIHWDTQSAAGLDRVALERSESNAGPWSEVGASPVADGGLTLVIDRDVTLGRGYWYRLVGFTAEGARIVVGPIQVQAAAAATEFALSGPGPNPTPGPFSVTFAVPRAAHVHLGLLDVQGREVAVLANAIYHPGRYRAQWDGAGQHGNVPVGIYFLKMSAGGQTFTQRVVINR